MRSAIEICCSLWRSANAVDARPAHHRAVVVHQLGKHADRRQARQAGRGRRRPRYGRSASARRRPWRPAERRGRAARSRLRRLLPLASARTVLVRSSAEMPVVRPWRTSTETVKAVPSGASFAATMGSRCRRLASSADSGAQTMPEVWRMMKAIFSGVQSEAATNRSPSFSRSSSSVTTTISPAAKAARTGFDALMNCRALFLATPSARRANGHAGGSPDLAALTQIVIGNHARHHGLADRHRADADAGIVAALGADLGLGCRNGRRCGAGSGSTRSA